jgi:hypothetical protein
MFFSFVQSLHNLKSFFSPHHPSWWLSRLARINPHEDIGISLSKDLKRSATLSKSLTESMKSASYLVGLWINVVLEVEKCVSIELLFLPENRVPSPSFCKGDSKAPLPAGNLGRPRAGGLKLSGLGD